MFMFTKQYYNVKKGEQSFQFSTEGKMVQYVSRIQTDPFDLMINVLILIQFFQATWDYKKGTCYSYSSQKKFV